MKPFDRLEALAQNLIEGAFSCLANDEPVDTKKVLSINAQDTAKRWLLKATDCQLPLGEPVINIGRALDNDIILNDPTVSRYHAQLRWREGRYYLCSPTIQSHSTTRQVNGTHKGQQSFPQTTVNQQPVMRRLTLGKALDPGDVIALGATKLTVVIERV